ncbi:MAG: trypsin-like peptidase domain-containing protein [Acidobacteriaceae bacterium]
MKLKYGVLFSVSLVWLTCSAAVHAQEKPEASSAATASPSILQEYDQALDKVAERVMRSVVQIDVTSYSLPERGENGDSQTFQRQRSLGSGVIVDPNGYIITNNHVVSGALRIRVTLSPATVELVTGHTVLSHKEHVYDATLIGTNRYADIAVIKIDEKNLPNLPLSLNYKVHLGQLVLAIGSPQGLDHTVTSGIISALGRQPDRERPMVYVQTDAPINPGNSGGPLVDRNGNLVGINTFIYTSGGGSEGLGFAIPEPIVQFAYAQIRRFGTIPALTIGAHAQTITPMLAAGLQLPQDSGVILSDVAPDGPGATGGLRPKDVVLSVDGVPIESLPKYVASLYLHPRGAPMEMKVLRDGKPLSVSLAPVPVLPTFENLSDLVNPKTDLIAPLGIFVVGLDPQLVEAMATRTRSGVVIAGLLSGEPATLADLLVGDVITSINGKSVSDKQQLEHGLASFKAGDPIVFEIERRGVTQYVAFEME